MNEIEHDCGTSSFLLLEMCLIVFAYLRVCQCTKTKKKIRCQNELFGVNVYGFDGAFHCSISRAKRFEILRFIVFNANELVLCFFRFDFFLIRIIDRLQKALISSRFYFSVFQVVVIVVTFIP